jgi:uncharacterized delta-60 repeat protein
VISNKIKEDGYVGARGILDTSFGDDGVVTHNGAAEGDSSDGGSSLILCHSGQILVCGSSKNPKDFDMALWCYREDGSLNEYFGSGGIVTHHGAAMGGNGNDYGSSIAFDENRRILICGGSENGVGDDDMAIWRYDQNGEKDLSFGPDGNRSFNSGDGYDDFSRSVTVDNEGRIIVCGKIATENNGFDLAIWRVFPDGNSDNYFGNNGMVTYHGGNWDSGKSIVLDNSSRILVCGNIRTDTTGDDLAIWRYMDNGSLDDSFGDNGVVTHHGAADGSNYHDQGEAITIDNRGRILVCGSSQGTNNYDLAIWRYMADGSLDHSFGGDGVVTHNGAAGGNSVDIGTSITLDNWGRIIVCGFSWNGNDYDMTIWRYNADGSLDKSFGNDGVVTHHGAAGGNGDDKGHSVILDESGRIHVCGESNNGSDRDLALWRYK